MLRGSRTRLIAAVTAAGIAASLAGARAAALGPPFLDGTFNAGSRRVDIRDTNDHAAVIAARADGSIVLAGGSQPPCTDGCPHDPVVAHMNQNGVMGNAPWPNPSGAVILSSFSDLHDMALAPGNKIVVLVDDLDDYSLVRLNDGGGIDTTFSGGQVPVNLGHDSELWKKILVQPDGKIVVIGHPHDFDEDQALTAIRFTADGDLDPTFGGTGVIVFEDFGDSYSQARDIAINPDGDRIAILADAQLGPSDAMGIAQLVVSNGALDTAFSNNGKVLTTAPRPTFFPNEIAYDANGKIVAGGTTKDEKTSSATAFVVARYRKTGILDTTFNGTGMLEQPLPGLGGLQSLLIATTGRILAFGEGNDGIAAVGLTSAGVLDTGFDGDGRLRIAASGDHGFRSAALTADGKILAFGAIGHHPNVDWVVNRFTASGAVDGTFKPSGVASYEWDSSVPTNDVANAVAIDNAGRLLLAGTIDYTDYRALAVLRLHANGLRDPAYGDGGWATVIVEDNEGHDIAMQGNSAFVVGCHLCSAAAPDFVAVKLTPQGIPDTAFSGDGRAALSYGSTSGVAMAAAVDSSGRLVMAGDVGGDFGVARLTAAGAGDDTFGHRGRVRTDLLNGSTDRVHDLAILPNGKILVVGARVSGGTSVMALAQYTSAGVLDTTFSTDGKATVQFGNPSLQLHAEATGVAIRPDGLYPADRERVEHDQPRRRGAPHRDRRDGQHVQHRRAGHRRDGNGRRDAGRRASSCRQQDRRRGLAPRRCLLRRALHGQRPAGHDLQRRRLRPRRCRTGRCHRARHDHGRDRQDHRRRRGSQPRGQRQPGLRRRPLEPLTEASSQA